MPDTDPPDTDDPNLIFEDDDQNTRAPEPADEEPPWRILIVDDDVDVHVVTKFALSNTHFQGRRLSYLHAYTGKEAIEILRNTPDIALVLLDVIMETADAGLRVARQVREELHNELVRVVLRTGQPGQALEHSIIVDYDINDFWCKADLTTRKLFTTVIASLRAYATLAAAVHARDALDAQLKQARKVQAALDQHALVLILDAQGRILDANPKFCELAGKTREQLPGHGVRDLYPQPYPEHLARDIMAALAHDGRWSGDLHATLGGKGLALRCTVLAVKAADGTVDQYTAVATVLDPAPR